MIQRKQQDNKLNWLMSGAAALIGLALFPYGWLAERWSLAGQVADFIFGTELAHVTGDFAIGVVQETAVRYQRITGHQRRFTGRVYCFLLGD